MSSWMEHEVVFDARNVILNFTELEATEYIFDNFGHVTTGVAMMNPVWKQPDASQLLIIAVNVSPKSPILGNLNRLWGGAGSGRRILLWCG